MDLAARSAVVQPALDGDLLAFVLADVFDVDVHSSSAVAISRQQPFHPLARLARPRERVLRRAVRGDLEHQRAVVADLLHRRQRRRPSRSCPRTARGDRRLRPRLSCTCVGDQVLRHRFDRVDEVAVEVRVAEVEADADVGRSRSCSTKCTSEPARDSSFGITSTAIRTPSGSAIRSSSSMLRRARVAAVVAAAAALRRAARRGARPAPAPESAARCAARARLRPPRAPRVGDRRSRATAARPSVRR